MRQRLQGTTAWAAVDQKRDGWEAVTPWLLVVLIIVSLGASPAIAAPLSADMIVSVPDQVLALVDRGKLIARYSISTSKFGTGDSAASYRTPLGTLFVSAKIGDRLPLGAVIKNRIPTGEMVGVDAPGRDAIVSRVIWLRGMETQNQKARDRCIYIHGTPEERRIGNPASFGCIRMRSRDIIDLYDRVHIGTHVLITLRKIHEFVRLEEPDLLAKTD
ncbi:MAG TPA: L,D-transpeptidase [Pyrinomonadaceae bacterium]|nr:L,D-transpeptidase [Pyrinomonadaceae bacterium]